MAIIVSNIRAGLSKNEDDVIDIALSKIKEAAVKLSTRI